MMKEGAKLQIRESPATVKGLQTAPLKSLFDGFSHREEELKDATHSQHVEFLKNTNCFIL